MTFRTRTDSKPTRRRTRENDSRRALLLNISFGFAIVAAIAMLGGVLFANYYGDHGAAVASVNGQAISKDAVRERAAVNKARYERQTENYGKLRNQGLITTDEYGTFAGSLADSQAPASLYGEALSQLTQESELQQYADSHGIKVTDAQINAEVTKDGTIQEMRHVMVIGVPPKPTAPASQPTAAETQAAQDQAQKYLDSIKSGAKKWDDVATESKAEQYNSTGDLNLTTRDALQLDPQLVNAVFDLKKVNDLTDVFKCEDGMYRFATVTAISPAFVDSDWQSAMNAAGKPDEYRSFARGQAVQEAVKEAVLKQYVTGPSVQRHVLEIAISPGYGAAGDGDEVTFRMMIFAPDHNSAGASTVAKDDAKWTEAKARADAAVTALKADPSKFDAMARDTKINDDQSWASEGGELPWLPGSVIAADPSPGPGLGMLNVATALFGPGVTQNQILGPVQETSAGYVVLQFLGRRPAPDQRMANIQLLLATGVDFSVLARQFSEASDANKGGDMGWVTRHMLDTESESAIFQAPVGGVSRMITKEGSGYWLFKVIDEQNRVPDSTEADKLRQVVFDNWLSDLTMRTNIWTDSAGLDAITPQTGQ